MKLPAIKLIMRHVLVLAAFLAASWLFYAPPADWWQGHYFGYGQDPIAFSWFLTWWPFAFSHHLPLLHTYYADWPAGTDLSWKTSVPALGLLAAPFTLQFGAMPVYSALMIASPALAGWGVYLAAIELTGAAAPAILAGLLFAMSGYEIGQGQIHLNLAFTLALPLCVTACLRAARRGWRSWQLALALGPLLAFEFGTSQEVFASALLFGAGALAACWWLHAGSRQTLRRLAPGIAAGVALALVLASPLLCAMLRGWAAARGSISDPGQYGNDVLAALIPTPLSLFGGQTCVAVTKAFTGNYTEQGGYYSLPLLILLVLAARRGNNAMRAVCALFLAALVAGWGPFLFVHGTRIFIAPWFPFAHLPLLSAMLPCRFSLYGWLAASFALALWLKGAGWRRYAAALACLIILAPAQSFDRNWRTLQLPAAFTAIPPRAHVLVLPEFGLEMGWQMLSNMRFVLVGQGYLGTGLPAPFNQWALFMPLWQSHFAAIDPVQFSAYLAYFHVQYAVVLDSGYDFYGPKMNQPATAAAARHLLTQAGWASANGTLFTPAHPPPANLAAIVSQQGQLLQQQGAAVRHAHALHREAQNICILRHAAARLHLPQGPFENIYAVFFSPPVPVQTINCPPPATAQ